MSYNNLRNGRYSQPYQEYFITTVTSDRIPVFKTLFLARTFIHQLQAIESTQDCQWLAWVLMPDHFHALVRLTGTKPLSVVMRNLKGKSSRALNTQMHNSGRLWQPGYYDLALRREEDRKEISRYIIANPLRAGLVKRLGDYPHWDTVWL